MSKYSTAPRLINKKPENFNNKMEIDRSAFIRAANDENLNKNELLLYFFLMGTKDGFKLPEAHIANCTGIPKEKIYKYRKNLMENGYIDFKPYSHYEVLGYKSDSKNRQNGGYNISGNLTILQSLLIECEYRNDIISYLFKNSPLNKSQIPEIEQLIDKFKIENTVPYYFIYKTLHGKVFKQKDIKSFNHLKTTILNYLKMNIEFVIESESQTDYDSYSMFRIDEEDYEFPSFDDSSICITVKLSF